MADTHNKAFFGQNVGLIINSPSKSDPFIFLSCFKKKGNGIWEKPSNGEGKIIKFSLEEIVMILDILGGERNSWSTFHSFKEEKTSISFKWDEKDAEKIKINIGSSYQKVLSYAQITIMRLLLEHILEEKIAFATTPQKKEELELQFEETTPNINELPIMKERVLKKNARSEKSTSSLEGILKSQTAKALLIEFKQGNEIWIPKSTIHSEYQIIDNAKQNFDIETWILEKNDVI